MILLKKDETKVPNCTVIWYYLGKTDVYLEEMEPIKTESYLNGLKPESDYFIVIEKSWAIRKIKEGEKDDYSKPIKDNAELLIAYGGKPKEKYGFNIAYEIIRDSDKKIIDFRPFEYAK